MKFIHAEDGKHQLIFRGAEVHVINAICTDYVEREGKRLFHNRNSQILKDRYGLAALMRILMAGRYFYDGFEETTYEE